MPSSLPDDESSRSLIPPTPESDFSTSPQSAHNICLSSSGLTEEPQNPIPQKRKAGRKPLYKTAQERRDRNRRAQLAFRARRSDYLARLEQTCRSLESVVSELQESNRVANDALLRERNRVRCLERMLQCSSTFSSPQVSAPFQAVSGISFAPDNGAVPASAEQQQQTGQQISPTCATQISSPSMTPLLFTENYLGKSPLPMIDFLVLV